MKRALVTGGTGFVGIRLVNALIESGVAVSVLTRDPARATGLWNNRLMRVCAGNITEPETLYGLCKEHDTVFHLAGYAHAEGENADDDRMRHESVSVAGTRFLLREAQEARIRRFVYVSSVKAMGEGGSHRLDESAELLPATSYGQARLVAEALVLAAGRETGMHAAVLRLPLVYGPGNKGNIPKMIAAIDQRRFPPLPKVENTRSMVHVDDVVRALLLVVDNAVANGQVFIVTDGRAYSTREIYEAICIALGQSIPRWSVPAWLLRFGAKAGDVLQHMVRRPMPLTTSTLEKLLGSAWYSSDKIRQQLGFSPRHTFFDALPEIVAEYRTGLAMKLDEPSDA